jgi:hypothetical protein
VKQVGAVVAPYCYRVARVEAAKVHAQLSPQPTPSPKKTGKRRKKKPKVGEEVESPFADITPPFTPPNVHGEFPASVSPRCVSRPPTCATLLPEAPG